MTTLRANWEDTMAEKRTLHCWKDYGEHLADTLGFGTPAYWDAWAASDGATCMLEEDHDGDHVFTPDSEIGVSFSDAQPVYERLVDLGVTPEQAADGLRRLRSPDAKCVTTGDGGCVADDCMHSVPVSPTK